MDNPMTSIDYTKLYGDGLPDPAPRWAPFPPYYFVGGNNDPEQIPIEGLVEAAASVLRREGSKLAIYNLGLGPQGYPGLRQFVADRCKRVRGMDVPIEDIMIVTGSGQGLDMISKLLVNPGDTVLCEEFCYQGAMNRFRKIGAKLEAMKLDDDGIVIDALAAQLAALKARGIAPKFIYTIPTIQNPTASILPLDRRHALLKLAREYNVAIFEDECYADLLWEGVEAPPALYALDPGCVIHLGSFSKSLAPALRLGYVVAEWEIMRRLLPLRGDSGTGALDQMVVAEYFSKHFEKHLGHLNGVLHDKLKTMVEAVEREFGASAECWHPKGGIFLWIKLPEGVDTRKLLKPAAAAGIIFNEGPAWAVSPDNSSSHLRLCFAMPSKQTIRDGVAALAQVCYEQTGIPVRSGNVQR
jgi:2-aminoadipate transaminase